MRDAAQRERSMEPEEFEGAFSEFWESQECDDLNWVLHDLIKAAFAAGYRAAGGQPPEYKRKTWLRWERREEP